jgi:hypothetical protein
MLASVLSRLMSDRVERFSLVGWDVVCGSGGAVIGPRGEGAVPAGGDQSWYGPASGDLDLFRHGERRHVRIDGVSQVVLGESGLQVVFTHSQGFPEAPPLVPPR